MFSENTARSIFCEMATGDRSRVAQTSLIEYFAK